MRLFRSYSGQKRPDGPKWEHWFLSVPVKLVRDMGWHHRDDLNVEIVGDEVRLKKTGPRDTSLDHVPGGKYDPFTGEIKKAPENAAGCNPLREGR